MFPYNLLLRSTIRTPDPADAADNQELATTAWVRRNGGGGGSSGPVSVYNLEQTHVGSAAQPLTLNGTDNLTDATAILFTTAGFYFVNGIFRMVQVAVPGGGTGTVGADFAVWEMNAAYYYPGGTNAAVCLAVNGSSANVDLGIASTNRSAAAANWRVSLGVRQVSASGGQLTSDAILAQMAIGEVGKTVRGRATLNVYYTPVP